jgi:asparagine N-glycosylation enzyme membrane subunit Stt3
MPLNFAKGMIKENAEKRLWVLKHRYIGVFLLLAGFLHEAFYLFSAPAGKVYSSGHLGWMLIVFGGILLVQYRTAYDLKQYIDILENEIEELREQASDGNGGSER